MTSVQIERNICCMGETISIRRLLTKKEIEKVIEDCCYKTRIQLGMPNNFEVGEVPIKFLAKAINKVQRMKIKGKMRCADD